MTQRGRKSAASKEMESLAQDHPEIGLTDPPEELTDEERAVWISAVRSMPPGWFKAEHRGTLMGLCRHTCYADRLAGLISEEQDKEVLCKLLGAHERETRAANALSRSMRLTHQSRYDEKHAHVMSSNNVTGDRLPWESH